MIEQHIWYKVGEEGFDYGIRVRRSRGEGGGQESGSFYFGIDIETRLSGTLQTNGIHAALPGISQRCRGRVSAVWWGWIR